MIVQTGSLGLVYRHHILAVVPVGDLLMSDQVESATRVSFSIGVDTC